MMEKLMCKSCGAPLVPCGIDTYKCEYCGSMYRRDYGYGALKIIEAHSAPVATLTAVTKVSHYQGMNMAKDDLVSYVVHNLAHELAEGLTKYMDIDIEEHTIDPYGPHELVRARVRIVPPGYRF